jgi:SAM-dependent methyltransferase
MRQDKIQAAFIARDLCIACGSPHSTSVSSGRFGDDPLRSFIESDPWGENPMPFIDSAPWDFRQCNDCGQRQHRYILAPEWNEIRFSQWMNAEAIREFETQNPSPDYASGYVQHALRLKDLGVKRLLDFGCGEGGLITMCRLFGIDAHGVDRSSARRSVAHTPIHAELEDAPGSFDAVTMIEVLEHLDDPLEMLLALKKRLNPGGIMVVEVPDTTGVDTFSDRESYYKIHPLDHINAFTPETLVRIMGRAGFKPIDKKPAFVTTSLKRVGKDIAKARLKRNTTQRYFA